MPTFSEIKDEKDYIALVAKYEKRLKEAIGKVDAAMAEMARARDTFLVKPPADAPAKDLQAYEAYVKQAQGAFGHLERNFAKVKAKCADLSKTVKQLS
jgi:hypothetical protein